VLLDCSQKGEVSDFIVGDFASRGLAPCRAELLAASCMATLSCAPLNFTTRGITHGVEKATYARVARVQSRELKELAVKPP